MTFHFPQGEWLKMVKACMIGKQVPFLQCSALFFPSVRVFEFKLTGIKYALFPVRNKVLLTIISDQRREHAVRTKVRILLSLPLEILSPQGQKPISEETWRKMMFCWVPWTQSRCMLIFTIRVHILSLSIIRSIKSLYSKILHCMPRGNLLRFTAAERKLNIFKRLLFWFGIWLSLSVKWVYNTFFIKCLWRLHEEINTSWMWKVD